MKTALTNDATEFLNRAQSFLEADEARNNFILAIAQAQKVSSSDQKAIFATVENASGNIATCAVQTPPMFFALTTATDDAIRSLVAKLYESGASAPGVVGPTREATLFADEWCALTLQKPRISMEQCLFRLAALKPPSRPVSGNARLATAQDLKLATDLTEQFLARVVPEEKRTRPQLEAMTEKRIKGGELYLWIADNGVASIASWVKATDRCARINMVYTPPGREGHGYGSALTAALSQALLAQRYSVLTLYTDLSNATANSIYKKLGFEPLDDCRMLQFVSPAT